MAYIAEIVSFFDLLAIQEVRRDLAALNKLQQLLGPNWGYIATDVTEEYLDEVEAELQARLGQP